MAYRLRIAGCGVRIIRSVMRLMRLLTRRGALVEEMGQSHPAKPDADGDKARTLRPLQAAAVAYRMPSVHAPVARW